MIIFEKNRIEKKLWKQPLERMGHTPFWRVVTKSLTGRRNYALIILLCKIWRSLKAAKDNHNLEYESEML